MDNLKQFIENVRLMRKWQKEYFKTRSPEALRWSKDLERRVDAALKAIDDEQAERENPGLF